MSKQKNSDGTNYKGAKAVKAEWKQHRINNASLKTWAREQPESGNAHTWLFNKRDK